jgi:hypothetical protein
MNANLEPGSRIAHWFRHISLVTRRNARRMEWEDDMACDIREPYILKAMGKACSKVMTDRGYIEAIERRDIADRIVARASEGETNIDRLVAFAMSGSTVQH